MNTRGKFDKDGPTIPQKRDAPQETIGIPTEENILGRKELHPVTKATHNPGKQEVEEISTIEKEAHINWPRNQ